MNFQTYWTSLDSAAKRSLAHSLNTSLAFLSQIAHGHRRCREALAIAIERDSAGAVTVEEMRPDVPWHVIRNRPAKRQVDEVAP
jgi:DNA-binding transcriptional regulator YdaS (Cro superfamily)